jgi:DNA-binding response OmpR family regulator
MNDNSPMADILIIEDRPLEREHLESVFSKRGYKTLTAESMEQAQERLNDSLYRLAIVDLGLQDRSGSPVFDMVKDSEKVDYIIILTGNPSTHLKQRFLSEGAAAYILKGTPEASGRELANQVEALLGGPLAIPT